MEYEQIKKLMDDMGNSKLTDVSIEFPDGIKISMKKDITEKILVQKFNEEHIPTGKEGNMSTSKEVNISTNNEKENNTSIKSEENCKIVKAPMVGTFYSKPSPDANSYVHIGQNVKKGEVLCVIEAMKLINEIESDFDGRIEEILVKDGEMVDFGKPLFKVI